MAIKEFNIKQERTFGGDDSTSYATVTCDDTEIAGFLAMLEGRLTVSAQDLTLSSAPDASTDVTTGLAVDAIFMSHDEAKTSSIYASRPLLFKKSVGVDGIQTALKLWKPFPGAYSTETPKKVIPKIASLANL